MQVAKTAQGKVLLWDNETGEPVERWPVDAKGMLAAGTHSATPVEGKEPGEGEPQRPAVAGAPVSGLTGIGVQFDPIKTPTMDLVAGATSPVAPVQPGEAVLGASMEVTALPPLEAMPGASAQALPGTDQLPKTTPTGAPAVHSTARGAAATDQAPVRSGARKTRG